MARSEVNRIYEADLAFRAPGSAAITATATGTVLALDKLVNARSGDQKNTLGAEGYEVVIVVSAFDDSSADETYTFTVNVGDETPSTVVATLVVAGTGQFIIPLDSHTLEKLDGDHSHISLTATLAGTTPSITYGAWLR